jgi:cytoskeletal protein RodZ
MEEEIVEEPTSQKKTPNKEGFVLISKKTLFYLVGVIIVFLCFFIAIGIVFLYLFFGNKKPTQPPPPQQKKIKKNKPKAKEEVQQPIDTRKKESEIQEETNRELINTYAEETIPNNIVIPSESEQEQDVHDEDD